MVRDYQINGESMVSVKGPAGSAISSLTQLGLADSPIQISMNFVHEDIPVDAWGRRVPPETQFMLAECDVRMTLIHYDPGVLDECLRLSMAGAPSVGQLPRAGTRMGGGQPRFASGNNFIGLNILSPVAMKPWRFFFSYLAQTPMTYPLGTERSIVSLNWRVIPYTQDPWNDGSGAQGTTLWDYSTD